MKLSSCDPTHVTRIILQPSIRPEAFSVISENLSVAMDNPRINSDCCLN